MILHIGAAVGIGVLLVLLLSGRGGMDPKTCHERGGVPIIVIGQWERLCVKQDALIKEVAK